MKDYNWDKVLVSGGRHESRQEIRLMDINISNKKSMMQWKSHGQNKVEGEYTV